MTIALVNIPDDQLTSYIRGGQTRLSDGGVPHVSMVLTVGRSATRQRWRLTAGAVAALAAVNADLIAMGGEPLRLTDAWRDQTVQAALRAGYDMWVDAGKPEYGAARWKTGMKTAYAALPNQSQHGWGGAIDIDVGAIFIPPYKRGSNEALSALWAVMKKHGWTPVISHPIADQSEAWHFDHFGPLAPVHQFAREAGGSYAPAYSYVARVGCALASTLTGGIDTNGAYVQARLALAGHFPGAIDGKIGPKTIAALTAAGVKDIGKKVRALDMIRALDELGVAKDQLAAA